MRGATQAVTGRIRAIGTETGEMTEYTRGDVVEVGDPFNDGDRSRPFLLVNTDAHPFDGEQYIAVTLTTRTWYEETIAISPDDFLEGGVPEESYIVPWGVTSPQHDDITDWFGRLDEPTVDKAVGQLGTYLGIQGTA